MTIEIEKSWFYKMADRAFGKGLALLVWRKPNGKLNVQALEVDKTYTFTSNGMFIHHGGTQSD